MKLTFPINIKSGIVQNNFELENFIFFKNKILFKFCINKQTCLWILLNYIFIKQTETYLPQMALILTDTYLYSLPGEQKLKENCII